MAAYSFCGADEHFAPIKLLKFTESKVPQNARNSARQTNGKHHKICSLPSPEKLIVPSLPVKEDEKPIVEALNRLSRSPIFLHTNRNNHWHFVARPISEEGSCLFATHPASNRTYIAGAFYLSANAPQDRWAACIVSYLLFLFPQTLTLQTPMASSHVPIQ